MLYYHQYALDKEGKYRFFVFPRVNSNKEEAEKYSQKEKLTSHEVERRVQEDYENMKKCLKANNYRACSSASLINMTGFLRNEHDISKFCGTAVAEKIFFLEKVLNAQERITDLTKVLKELEEAENLFPTLYDLFKKHITADSEDMYKEALKNELERIKSFMDKDGNVQIVLTKPHPHFPKLKEYTYDASHIKYGIGQSYLFSEYSDSVTFDKDKKVLKSFKEETRFKDDSDFANLQNGNVQKKGNGLFFKKLSDHNS